MKILCQVKSVVAKVINPIAGKNAPTAILVAAVGVCAAAVGLVVGVGIAIANRFGVKV